jgi:long-chain acyl-CoA synthetase
MEKVWLKNYDGYVPTTIDYPKEDLYALFRKSATVVSGQTALVFFDDNFTYRQLLTWTDNFAAALAAHGVGKGDRIMLSLPNCPQFAVAYYALQKLGAVPVMINPMSVAREIEYKCANAEAKGMIALDLFWDTFFPAAQKVGLDLIIFSNIFDLHSGHSGEKAERQGGALDFRELVMTEYPEVEPANNKPDDLAVIIYTGGTTGDPKGAMLSQMNIISNTWAISNWFQIEPNERGLAVLPFFHGFGMQVMLNCFLLQKGSLVLMPTFEIESLFKLVDQYKPTVMVGVPTMFTAINTYPERDKYDMSSIKVACSGGAPLPFSVKHEFEAFTGGKLLEGYGLTESTCAVCANPVEGLNLEGSIGIPMSDVEMKIVDIEDGSRELPIGEIGEILVKSPTVMLGYYKNPKATAETMRHGWLFTGDIGRATEDGYFEILDRKKDMIIAGGFNIYPKEVENAIQNHPDVLEVAVVGVPDEYRGETVKAFVTLKQGAQLTEDQLVQYCRENMIRYMVPKLVEFRDELPKSPVGKILRKELKGEALSASGKE